MAQVSYQDAAALLHSATSKMVVVTITSGSTTPLPAPDLSGINGRTFTILDDLVITYHAAYTGFIWSMTPVGTGAPALRVMSAAPVSGFPTSAPRLSLAGFGLTPGSYQVTVQAQNGSQLSPSANARIELVLQDLSAARVYPNPWRADKHSIKKITFDQLSGSTEVKIFSASGHLVRDLGRVNSSVTWDLTNESGSEVASGLYIYLITNDQGQKSKGKLAVIR